MIDFETFCKIHDCHDRQGLTIAQTARALGLAPKTVATWVARPSFEPGAAELAPVFLILSSRISRDCWTPTYIALSRSSSVCARRATAAA